MKIIHISNLHIFDRNYVNIQTAITNLVSYISDLVNSNQIKCRRDYVDMEGNAMPTEYDAIIVICGDIFEYTHLLNPVDIKLFHYIMSLLEKKMIRTIILPGIHDMCEIGSNSINTISSVLSGSSYQYIEHYHCPCKITISGVDFYINPYTKTYDLYPNIDEKTASETILISYIPQTYSDIDYSVFHKYRGAILGGNSSYTVKYDNVAYSGSFVQKNKHEGIIHGCIVWEVEPLFRGIFKEIKQQNYYLVFRVENDTLLTPKPDVSAKFIEIEYKDCTSIFLNNMVSELYKKYNRDAVLMGSSPMQPIERIRHTDFIDKILHENNMIEYREKIHRIHGRFMKDYKTYNGVTWKLNYLLWENVMCYGVYNFINFNDVNGIVSLTGQNKTGKSTIIDILAFQLFNEQLRGEITFGEDNSYIKCSFSQCDVEYIVIRSNRNISLTKSGTMIACSIESVYHNLDMILGSYSNFLNMTVAIQHRQFLTDMSNQNKISFFFNFLKISDFWAIEKKVNKEISIIEKKVNKLKTLDEKYKKYNIGDRRNDIKNEIKKSLSVKRLLQEEMNELIKSKAEYGIHVKEKYLDPSYKQPELLTTREKILHLPTYKRLLNTVYAKLADFSYIEKINAIRSALLLANETRGMGNNIINNIFDSNLRELDGERIVKEIIKLNKIVNYFESEKAKLDDILAYKKHIESLEDISICDRRIKLVANKIAVNDSKYISLICERDILNNKYKHTEDNSEMIKSLYERIKIYNIYHKCINTKTGIPNKIVLSACRAINTRANSILRSITDFQIRVSYDNGKISIDTFNSVKFIPAILASGFQKFIIDFVFRVFLNEIADVPKSDIIFIDEGFGCLDSENFNDMLGCLQRVKNNFRALFVISHIAEVQNVSDVRITIKRLPQQMSNLQFGSSEGLIFDNKPSHEIKKVDNIEIKPIETSDSKSNCVVSTKHTPNNVMMTDISVAKYFKLINGRYRCVACRSNIRNNNIQLHIGTKSHRLNVKYRIKT